MKKLILVLCVLFVSLNLFGQKIKLSGVVTNESGEKMTGVIIRAYGNDETAFASTDNLGYYELKLSANTDYQIFLSFMAVVKDSVFISTKDAGFKKDFVIPNSDYELNPIYAISNSIDETGMERISSKSLTVLPDISGNAVETLIKTGMGVSSGNELSSQYNVRGGNFDENLIYVNDVLIYRPFLIRSGQQEGLSFVNSDLVSAIKFSAGGFDAKYDDKMSSVLDITYKTPKKFAASVAVSLLGGTAHIENISKNEKWTYVAGFRHKRSEYLLKTLKIKGDYRPVFTDFQSYITYKANDKLTFAFLSNVSQNVYNFIPRFSENNIGTFNTPLSIKTYFGGKEQDSYQAFFGSFSTEYKVNNNLKIKAIASSYYTIESEKYDIDAVYYLNEMNTSLDSANKTPDSLLNIGYGHYLRHARNYLNAFITDASVRAYWLLNKHILQFGIKYQNENIDDVLSEWRYVDSAGYSTSMHDTDIPDILEIYSIVKSKNKLTTNRLSLFVQDGYNFGLGTTKFKATYGVRCSYNDYNNEFLTSPRLSVLITPDWFKKWYFRVSSGIYYQSPFYREIRMFDGTLVEKQKSQRSLQFIAGVYRPMRIWDRPFKLSTEIYFKKFDNLIPYELDNLQVRYYADQRATGFAVGADFKLYGEFVPGTDSWVSLSILKTMEDVIGDEHYEYYDSEHRIAYEINDIVDSALVKPGFIPRPSDKLVSLGMFFQDYVPGHKNFKLNLAFFFNSSAPFGPPQTARYNATSRSSKPYMRADIGLSFLIKGEHRVFVKNKFFNSFKSIWGQVEFFNFMNISNIASYSWIDIVPNTGNPVAPLYRKLATPNKLTGMLVNFKLTFNF